MGKNLIYHPKLYLSDALLGKSLYILKHRIRRGKGGYYVLAMPANPDDLLDLIPCKYLKSYANMDRMLDVVGLARDEDDAQKLLQIIVCVK